MTVIACRGTTSAIADLVDHSPSSSAKNRFWFGFARTNRKARSCHARNPERAMRRLRNKKDHCSNGKRGPNRTDSGSSNVTGRLASTILKPNRESPERRRGALRLLPNTRSTRANVLHLKGRRNRVEQRTEKKEIQTVMFTRSSASAAFPSQTPPPAA